MSESDFPMPPDCPSDGAEPRCWHFRLKNRLAALVPFNEELRACMDAGGAGSNDGDAATIHLLLDELLTNVIKYGHPGDDGEHDIAVHLCLKEWGFVLAIEDDGIPFDPTRAPERSEEDLHLPLEEREVGGWGLSLVRRLVDEVEYRRDQSMNKLTLRKGSRQASDGVKTLGD
jgi:serine/threonine-protein kinase RsbW